MSESTSTIHFRKYFHDRFVLLVLTVNAFIAIVTVVSILLRLGDTSGSYIQAFRSNLGLNAYQVGDVGQIVSFAVFAVAVLAGQFVLSLKFYAIRKHAAWLIMLLGTLLLVLSLIVSNALIQLH